MPKQTLVLFVRDSEGALTAVFPHIPATTDARHMTCYDSRNMHHVCVTGWLGWTKLADLTDSDVRDLLAELGRIPGYENLRIGVRKGAYNQAAWTRRRQQIINREYWAAG